MLYIATDSRRSYHGMVARLVTSGGAELIELDPGVNGGIVSKARIVRQLLAPRLLALRHRWDGDDVVLVIAWYALPILALIRLGILNRPRRLVSMAGFVHSPALRRLVNRFFRQLMIDEMEFITFSAEEARSLTQVVGVAPQRVHRVVYRGRLAPETTTVKGGPRYVFTGGYSNRDYATFFAAVSPLPYRAIAVVSGLNRVRDAPANVDLRVDLPWAEFEQLLADCDLLVLPLHATGEASGQNVLQRGMRYLLPVVATRHDALTDYLGADYPGFVAPGDPEAMEGAIRRAMTDEPFRHLLIAEIAERRERLVGRGEMADEILAILQS